MNGHFVRIRLTWPQKSHIVAIGPEGQELIKAQHVTRQSLLLPVFDIAKSPGQHILHLRASGHPRNGERICSRTAIVKVQGSQLFSQCEERPQ